MNQEPLDTLTKIAQAIYDKKGFNTLILDVRGISSMTDYLIIAEGTVDRHVKAIGHSIQKALLEDGIKPSRVEGEQDGDWVILDYIDFVIHLLIPDFRIKYSLEELWRAGKVVSVKIDASMPEIKNGSTN